MTATAFYITGIYDSRKHQICGPFFSKDHASEFLTIIENFDWQSCPVEFSRPYPMPRLRHAPVMLYISENDDSQKTWLGLRIGRFSDAPLFRKNT